MNARGRRLTLAALMAGAAACAHAQAAVPVSAPVATPTPARATPWSGNGQVGGQWVSGAYGALGLTLQHDLDYSGRFLQGDLSTTFGFQSSSAEGETLNSANQPVTVTQRLRSEDYGADLHVRVPTSGSTFGVFRANWTRAPNQGLNARVLATAGAGIRLGPSPRQATVELAAGRMREDELDGHRLGFGTIAASLGVQQEWGAGGSVSASVDVIQNLSVRADVLSIGSLNMSAPLTRHLSLTLGYRFTWDGRPSDAAFDPTGVNDDFDFSVVPSKFAATLSSGLSITWR